MLKKISSVLIFIIMLVAYSGACFISLKANSEESYTSTNINNALALQIKPLGTSSLLLVTLTNKSKSPVTLVWDEYSRAKILGQFQFTAMDKNGKQLQLTNKAAKIYQANPEIMAGIPVSFGRIIIKPNEAQNITFNFAKLFTLAVPSVYEVRVKYIPSTIWTNFKGSITSKAIPMNVNSISKNPALFFTAKGLNVKNVETENP